MDFNTSDYFAYKKNKLQKKEQKPKSLSKINFLFQLFIATFVIIFIIIVIAIMKYSSRMDIEYSKGDLSMHDSVESAQDTTKSSIVEEEQGKIDKRLIFIQQEENAPSEAKIIDKAQNKQEEVINPVHIEENKKIEKIEKIEKIKAQNAQSEAQSAAPPKKEEVKLQGKKQETTAPLPINAQKNITIMSKVLIGRYSSFEEAQKMQTEIKEKDPNTTPFVRKTGDVFSVQMGSYQDFSIAKRQAQVLKTKGYDVWIYQQ